MKLRPTRFTLALGLLLSAPMLPSHAGLWPLGKKQKDEPASDAEKPGLLSRLVPDVIEDRLTRKATVRTVAAAPAPVTRSAPPAEQKKPGLLSRIIPDVIENRFKKNDDDTATRARAVEPEEEKPGIVSRLVPDVIENKISKKPAKVPPMVELQGQNAVAAELLANAQAAESSGKSSKALSAYKQIVSKYPLSSSASEAQYQVARLTQNDGKLLKAFEEYQILVENYKASPYFSDALDAQYAIALEARTGKLGKILGISKKLGIEDTADLFRKIVANAPQGPHAAESQFEIGEIYRESEDTPNAINAYQDVVDQYPRSAQAADSQQLIAELNLGRVVDGSRDSGAIKESREAANQATLFPGGESEAQDLITQIDDQEAENAYKIARFYEKKGNYKAAVIYYNDVLRFPGGPNFEDARERVSELVARDPKLLESNKNLTITNRQLAVRASADVKGRPDYLGPPAPAELDRHLRKPSMRNSDDTIPIIPIEEPNLPGGDGSAKPEDLLLNPNDSILPPAPTDPLENPAVEIPPSPPPPDDAPMPETDTDSDSTTPAPETSDDASVPDLPSNEKKVD